MASQEQLRTMFNGMDIVKKGQFIDNLQKMVEGGGSTENAQFLEECMEQYKRELGAAAKESKIGQLFDNTSEAPPLELELELEPEPNPEPEPELESELELELESELELELEPELELELEPELELELESSPELEVEPADTLQSAFADYTGSQKSVPERTASLSVPEIKIENIALGISEIYNNIQRNMSVIETISHLLSENGSSIVEAITQAYGIELTLALENAGDFENIVEFIEASFSELVGNIRKDMSTIEAISSLLSDKESTLATSAAQALSESPPLPQEEVFAPPLLPQEEVFAPPLLPQEEEFAPPPLPQEEVFAPPLLPQEEEFAPPPLPQEEEFAPPPLPQEDAFTPPPLPQEDAFTPPPLPQEDAFTPPPLPQEDAFTPPPLPQD